jgi:hypothetical protein
MAFPKLTQITTLKLEVIWFLQNNRNVHNKNFFDILFFEISAKNFYIDLVVPDICPPLIVLWGTR